MSYSKLARTSDPITSHEAAAGIGPKLTVRAKQFLEGLEKLGQATANEVAVSVAGGNIGLVGSIRRRASDLDEIGLIRVCGRRVCRITGKVVSLYELVPQKKKQLELFQ